MSKQYNQHCYIKKQVIILSVFLIISMMILPTVRSQETETIRFGALAPLTGDLAIMGQTALKTFDIAETNLERLFNNVDFEIVVEDTQTDPDVALDKIQILHEQGIRVIVGPFASSCVEKIKAFADEHEILIISPTSTSMSLAQDDYIFRLIPNEAYKANAVAAFLQNQSLDSIVLLYRDDAYGNGYLETFKPLWTGLGGEIAGEVSYSPDETDFTETVRQLGEIVQTNLDAGKADRTAVLAISYEEIGTVVKSAAKEEALSQVRWFENETAAHIEAFLNDEEVMDFAERTKFSFASNGVKEAFHPTYPHVPKCENLLTQIYQETEKTIQEDILFYVYDACQASSFISIMIDFFEPKQEFIRLSNVLLGVSGFCTVDENGDRASGVIAFNQFDRTGGEAGWKLTASFRDPFMGLRESFEYYEFPASIEPPSIRVGALLSLTGDNATIGQEIEKTLAMAKEDLNAYLKREFIENASAEILIADTGSDPQTALAKIQEMHAQGVNLFVGPLTSEELLAVSSYVNENGLTLISPSSTSLDLAIDDNIFRFALDNGKLANALAAYYIDNGIDFVQTVYRDDAYGTDFQAAFQTKFEERGGVCGQPISYEPNASDFNDVVEELTDSIVPAEAEYGAKRSSVLIVALDEALDLFRSIPEDSILREVCWIGGDGLAGNEPLIQDQDLLRFVRDTKFTAIASGNESYNYIGMFERTWRKVLQGSIGKKPIAYSYMAYDAAWYTVMLSIKEAYEGDGFDRKEGLTDLVNGTQTPFQYYRFNDEGDSIYGYTDFYTPYEENDEMKWYPFAKYSYQFDGENLFYIDNGPLTAVEEWMLHE